MGLSAAWRASVGAHGDHPSWTGHAERSGGLPRGRM